MTTPFKQTIDSLNREFNDQLTSRLEAIRSHYQSITPDTWNIAEAKILHRLIHSLPDLAENFEIKQLLINASRTLENNLTVLMRSVQPPANLDWSLIGHEIDQLEQLKSTPLDPAATHPKPVSAAFRATRSPLIYLAESDRMQADSLERALVMDGFRVEIFTEPKQFRAICNTQGIESPAAVIIDMLFTELDLKGVQLIAELGLGGGSDIPVIMTSVRDDIPARLAAFRAGASRYLIKPADSARVIDILDALTGRQPPQPYRVLLVDDDAMMLEIHAAMLQSAGMEVRKLSEPLKILNVLEDFSPDVAVFDVYMPEASGPELAAILRERDAYLNLPILFLSGETDITQQLLALNLGGDDFLVKPVQLKHLLAVVTARARRARQNTTLRRRLETTLYELEREHLAINQHALVSIADCAGMITYVNEQFCEVSGYQRHELMGQSHAIIKSHQHSPEFYQDLWYTITKGQVWQGEICNKSKDGNLYWVESTITPFLDDNGQPYQFVSIHTNISHVKEVEAALQVSEERYQLAIVASQDGLWDWNMATGRVYYSPRWEAMFGFETGSAVQSLETFTPLVHKDDVVGMFNEVERYLRREIPIYNREFRMQRLDGSLMWTLHQAVGIFDESGKPIRLIGTTTDTTARKTAEVALRATLDSTQDGILAVNHAGLISFTNRLFCEMWQIPETLIQGMQIDRSLLELAQARFLDPEAFLSTVQSLYPSNRESKDILEFTDGRIFEVHSKPWMIDQDGCTGRVWSFRDITENKQGELALAESAWQLRHAQQVANLGSFDWKPISGELRWSDEHFRLWGLPPQSSVPNYALFRQGIHPDDVGQVEKQLQQTLETGNPYECLHRVIWPDGSIHFIRAIGEVLLSQDAQPTRMIGSVQDVTEQVAVEQALIAARDDAERANQAKSEFLASMSHELRTPMNAILGFGQLLEYDEALTENQLEDVQAILKAGHHLLELINEVLDLSKVESGNIDLSLEPVEVMPVLEECLNLVSTLADKRHINIQFKGQAGINVRADRTRLKQVLLNLLSNAIKYNQEGGSVLVEVEPMETGLLCIRVTDTGSGIPLDRQNELFQPFNRLDAEYSNIEGTGIGLTITRRLLEIMGGEVYVHSEVGVGSTFWIELPLESLPVHLCAEIASNDKLSPENESKQTVLYIEDNPVNIKLVAQILGRRKNIRLLTAHTPELGIALALSEHPELILLDINLPGMNGYQVLELFKQNSFLNQTPVIAITANAMQRDIERGKAAGFTDYLTKPIDIPTLYRVLDQLIKAPQIIKEVES